MESGHPISLMGVVNLTPDSFWEASRVTASQALGRMERMCADGAGIIDLGAVSTRPGAGSVDEEEEWARLEPVLRELQGKDFPARISVDTCSASVVRRTFDIIGPFMVNDISSGEDDPGMLSTVSSLGLGYVAMHKRGGPSTMDGLCDYQEGVMAAVKEWFQGFALRATEAGISDWVLDPGLGFAKTPAQCWELLENESELLELGRPILIGAADKRFTGGDTEKAHRMALKGGASILRVHDVAAAVRTVKELGLRIR